MSCYRDVIGDVVMGDKIVCGKCLSAREWLSVDELERREQHLRALKAQLLRMFRSHPSVVIFLTCLLGYVIPSLIHAFFFEPSATVALVMLAWGFVVVGAGVWMSHTREPIRRGLTECGEELLQIRKELVAHHAERGLRLRQKSDGEQIRRRRRF